MNTECICITFYMTNMCVSLKWQINQKICHHVVPTPSCYDFLFVFLWNKIMFFPPEIIFIPFNDILSYISVCVSVILILRVNDDWIFMKYPFKDASIYYV